MAEVYDSDDAWPRSPVLQPAVVKYGPDEPSPPFPHKRPVSRDRRSGDSPGSDGARSRKHHRTNKPLRSTQGDAVLIGILGPNHPDIALQAGERPLRSESDSDDDYRERVKLSPRPSVSASVPASDVSSHSQVATKVLDHLVSTEHGRANNVLPPISELVSQEPVFPPPPSYLRRGSEQLTHDGLATSGVARYAISPSEMPAQELLPALQSPPHSAAASPENTQSLPPVQSLLRDLSSVSVASVGSSHFGAVSAPSPAVVHSRRVSSSLPPPPPPPSQSQIPTPSYSHASPMSMKELTGPSPAAQSPYWRPPGFKSEGSNVSTMYETPSQASLTGKSPANNYPTPTEPRPVGEENPEAGNLYKCQFPDCTAPPFQTQYLLNSHANVHSQERPHYCPVPDCPRGIGGKGFKRKNEMIRHGLVHDSPGYVCPFCTDQQHKYPRPDNLQRHVKAHHVDRSKDDPELRNVLAQRPKGSGRGRRRRGHT